MYVIGVELWFHFVVVLIQGLTTMHHMLALNLLSSCLSLRSLEMTDVCHHTHVDYSPMKSKKMRVAF